MGVDHYDCDACGDNGIHSSEVNHCEEGHVICNDCVEEHHIQIDTDHVFTDEDIARQDCFLCNKAEAEREDKKKKDKIYRKLHLIKKMTPHSDEWYDAITKVLKLV